MQTVRINSYAKVNLTLEIVGEKEGYHLLDSLVASVDISDHILVSKRRDKLSAVTMHGLGSESIPPEKNNALKAAEAFSRTFGVNGAEITVYKNIPMGAGLGGSSADVSGVLNGMAQLYGITDRKKLKEIADSLGSDTGYMLDGGFARMQGRGEIVTPISTGVKLHFLLLCPNSTVGAGECYACYDKMPNEDKKGGGQTEKAIAALCKNDKNGLGRYLTNDLFLPAAALNADVKKAYEEAWSFSPLGVVMTGSGSCVMALFETKELCEWAKSRYRGKCRAYVAQTLKPEYSPKPKNSGFFRNPFALTDEEEKLLDGINKE